MVRYGVNVRRYKEHKPRKIKNNQASFKLIAPFAIGLLAVRLTNLSSLWSLISLIIQPHDLTNTAPIKTIRIFLKLI